MLIHNKTKGATSPPLVWEPKAVSYVLPNVVLVTGRDATLNAFPGSVVFVPGGGWSSVQEAVYSGGNTTIILSDATCFPGMATIGYASPVINPTNLCTGGTPIDDGGSNKANAFDGVLVGTYWSSYFSSPNLLGQAYLGYQFASAKSIRWFRVLQTNTYYWPVTSLKLQYSDNGSAWTDSFTTSVQPELFQKVVGPIPAAPHVYWRILANSNSGSASYWGIIELQMGA